MLKLEEKIENYNKLVKPGDMLINDDKLEEEIVNNLRKLIIRIDRLKTPMYVEKNKKLIETSEKAFSWLSKVLNHVNRKKKEKQRLRRRHLNKKLPTQLDDIQKMEEKTVE